MPTCRRVSVLAPTEETRFGDDFLVYLPRRSNRLNRCGEREMWYKAKSGVLSQVTVASGPQIADAKISLLHVPVASVCSRTTSLSTQRLEPILDINTSDKLIHCRRTMQVLHGSSCRKLRG